jgi:predicted nucleic acid-binding protein
MSVYIVDASIAAKWFLAEEHCAAARRLLDGAKELCAPEMLLLEMDAIVLRRVRLGEISEEIGQNIRFALRQLPIKVYGCNELLDDAYDIALETGCGLFDCVYVSLAAKLGGRMATADRRLCKALAGGPYEEKVLWVEDFRE